MESLGIKRIIKYSLSSVHLIIMRMKKKKLPSLLINERKTTIHEMIYYKPFIMQNKCKSHRFDGIDGSCIITKSQNDFVCKC